jgi:hypothetical protein
MKDREPISLHEVLAQNAEYILDQLLTVLLNAEGTTYHQMSSEVLQRRIQQLFDAFWQTVAQNNPEPMVNYIWKTSRERGNEGFTVADLQTVALCMRDAMLTVVDEVYADAPVQRLHHSRRIEELILSGIGAGVRGFVDGREALISRQFEALRRSQKPKGYKDQE